MSSNKLKILVIDDEDDIREILINRINESYDMEVVGEADSVTSAFELISTTSVDAIFLDIKIKEGDAFQLLRLLQRKGINIPPIIINTGYREFDFAQKALNEFGEFIIMILKKPFWENWAEKENAIIEKIMASKTVSPSSDLLKSNIIVKHNNTTHFINLDDLRLVITDLESKGSGKILLHTKDNSFSIYKSLRTIEEELPSHFLRVSRYAIVNSLFIERIDHLDQTIHLRGYDSYVGIGDAFKKNIKKLIEG